MATDTVDGFSVTNRWLLYTSVLLAPAQFMSGINSNAPTSLGFLAYNWYTQIQWYQAVQARQLNALSLLLPHFNLIYAISYMSGISSGNIYMGILLGLGTAGVLVLNSVSAWIGWSSNQTNGFGEYQFFFFGWRTLNSGWHKFFLAWQIGDSLLAFMCVIFAIVVAVIVPTSSSERHLWRPWKRVRNDVEESNEAGIEVGVIAGSKAPGEETRPVKEKKKWSEYFMADNTYTMIPKGAITMLIACWPLILWTELIISRNKIESDTDKIAVWLFIAQVGTMLLPSRAFCVQVFKFICKPFSRHTVVS